MQTEDRELATYTLYWSETRPIKYNEAHATTIELEPHEYYVACKAIRWVQCAGIMPMPLLRLARDDTKSKARGLEALMKQLRLIAHELPDFGSDCVIVPPDRVAQVTADRVDKVMRELRARKKA